MVKEKLGICQTRAHHALVALDHRACIRWADIAHHEELVSQFAARVQEREVFLIGLHGQNQTLLRHSQKLCLKAAHQYIGALYQSSHFVKQGLVFNGDHTAPYFGGCRRQLLRNVGFAFFKAGNHRTLLAQCVGIGIRMRYHHGRHLGLKPMPLRAVARLEPQRLNGHDISAMQSQQTMRRPHKAHTAPAGQLAALFQLVAHHLGYG